MASRVLKSDWNDREYVLRKVKNNGLALKFASEDLKRKGKRNCPRGREE
jgi:hypothetical protein